MPPYIYTLCGGHLVPGNNMLWRVPSFPKYHQTSITFYLHKLPLRQCTTPDIYCYGKLNYSSDSIKLCFLIRPTFHHTMTKARKRNYGLSEIESANVSSAHLCLENQLCLNAIHSRNDTFQSQAIKLTYQSVIIDTLSQCHLHNDLAMYWCFWHVSISKQSRLHN